MNARAVRRIRQAVYGKQLSHRFRRYFRLKSGQIIADPKRREYQEAKNASRKRQTATVHGS